MEQRYIKTALAVAVGLLLLFWLLNNLINWPFAQGAVAYMLSQADQGGYPNHLVPAFDNPALSLLVLVLICAVEAAGAALALFGAARMWAHRHSPGGFTAAKRLPILACGLGVLLWFGLFQVFGGTLVMMGQNESGGKVLEGAFRFAVYVFLTLIYLSMPEPEPRTSSN